MRSSKLVLHAANGVGQGVSDLIDVSQEVRGTLIVTGAGADTVMGGTLRDKIQTGKDDDIVWGGDGNDLIRGGRGMDMLYGEDGRDKIWGGQGADLIDGGADDDVILAGLGHDVVAGGTGDDMVFAGKGNDVIAGGAGDDTIRGGHGSDTAVFAGSVLDFDWSDGGDGWIFVEDMTGAEGRDKLRGIEVLQFDDATIALSAGNAPIIRAQPVTAQAGGVTVFDIRAYDVDGDAMALDSVSVTGPGHLSAGSVSSLTGAHGETGFALSFDSLGGYTALGRGGTATETISIAVRDDSGSVTETQVALTVVGINDAPSIDDVTGLGQSLALDGQTGAQGQVVASDPDAGDMLGYAVAGGSQGSFGWLSVDATGGWSYELNPDADALGGLEPGELGADSFVFVVSDSDGLQATRAVSFEVSAPEVEPADLPGVTRLTFDDLSDDSTRRFDVPDGYGGLTWSEFALIMETDELVGDGTGYVTGAVSGDNIVYNSFSRDLTISRETPFDLEQATVTAAVRDGLELTVTGFLDGAETGVQIFALTRDTPKVVDFDDEIFDEVDAVTFATNFASLGQFAMDDLIYIG